MTTRKRRLLATPTHATKDEKVCVTESFASSLCSRHRVEKRTAKAGRRRLYWRRAKRIAALCAVTPNCFLKDIPRYCRPWIEKMFARRDSTTGAASGGFFSGSALCWPESTKGGRLPECHRPT
ncbi:unnamed protein product [Caenorhabditis auriculariae]|uniref:Uncharacterized protein n=1 Tax=Caenorhabditis auriculariae TaxID=2777116 RepID=A0A8S1HNL8_9PELO|nr:unnamed protein product [Caenorhabditis auriculariae]